MVCRSALHVVTPPPDNWYKDEGGKNNCIAIEVLVRVRAKASFFPLFFFLAVSLFVAGWLVVFDEKVVVVRGGLPFSTSRR